MGVGGRADFRPPRRFVTRIRLSPRRWQRWRNVLHGRRKGRPLAGPDGCVGRVRVPYRTLLRVGPMLLRGVVLGRGTAEGEKDRGTFHSTGRIAQHPTNQRPYLLVPSLTLPWAPHHVPGGATAGSGRTGMSCRCSVGVCWGACTDAARRGAERVVLMGPGLRTALGGPGCRPPRSRLFEMVAQRCHSSSNE